MQYSLLSPKTRDNRILSLQESLKTEKKNLIFCYANKVILTNALIDDCNRFDYCENGVIKDFSNLTSHVKKSIRIKITSCLSLIECITKKSLLKIDYITNKLQEIEVNKSNSKYHLIDKILEEFKSWNGDFKKNIQEIILQLKLLEKVLKCTHYPQQQFFAGIMNIKLMVLQVGFYLKEESIKER